MVFKSFTWITKISFQSHLHLLRWENNFLVYNQATKTVKNPGYPFFHLQPFIGRIFMSILQQKPTTKSLITDNIDSTHWYSMIILTSSNKISE